MVIYWTEKVYGCILEFAYIRSLSAVIWYEPTDDYFTLYPKYSSICC
jgi:hypothetical protein